ncbi:histidinol-phosphate transaminase [Marixanthomonas spongiae]|uniref:Histidinol-phosphate aminotransferase n=1 Tax=Marixanthomonas spongiae TaxID=2174845 RepID=A0A2U0HY65_9FLAO|nr:histidinol-phosphate transaminase [Marixanthomonas spongiae]PVW13804.1 histidinol-phosphate transaminase [Marixanthomonas spongiae]
MKNTFNLKTLVRPNVAALEPYSSARDEFTETGASMVFLDANENPFENGVNRYPDPQQRRLKKEIGTIKGISEKNMLLGNGSDEVLDLLFRAFCEPAKDNIITLPPTYGMYKVLAGINNIENREVLLTEAFQPNIPAILETVDAQTKIIFLCSPNNPTGTAFSEAKIKQLLSSFKGLVVIDEAYIDFSEKESWSKKLARFPNLVVTQTLSKAYGMAGIRLGICFASEEIIAVLNKIKPPYNINSLTQEKAIHRLQKISTTNNEIDSLIIEKNKLYKALLEVNFINKIIPSEANFILCRVDDATKRYNQLLEKGFVVRNRSSQPLCENMLRFTVGTPEENARLIASLKQLQ